MWLRWLPWRFIVRRAAKTHGFMDPVTVLSQLQQFSQPGEVVMPTEILRLGYIMQARGLMNGQAIQHNLDWVWPFWAKRQFNPRDPAFVPRAFSMTHINLTHRNWTAVGMPGFAGYPLVDPRGLVTPFYDSWSLDFWIVTENKKDLIPAELDSIKQELLFDPGLTVMTAAAHEGLELRCAASVQGLKDSQPFLRLEVQGRADRKAWLAVSVRPYNPEGVSFIHDISLLNDRKGWQINKKQKIFLEQPWESHSFSQYKDGDVYRNLPSSDSLTEICCPVGLATAAALFEIMPRQTREVSIHIPLTAEVPDTDSVFIDASAETGMLWSENLRSTADLHIPDERCRFLYEAALRSIVLHAPHEVYPGPYTYKHFWFRDAVLICYAMLCSGLTEKVEKIIEVFWKRQTITGYFHSQDGEWDSNGQVLWLLHKFCLLTNRPPKPEWLAPIRNAVRWIQKKRVPPKPGLLHSGLFPAGFSAEHLGPSDFYYWDDFWGAEGLASAAWLLEKYGEKEEARKIKQESRNFMTSIEESLKKVSRVLGSAAMPASPYRRMDAGAVGSVVAGYPLRLWEENDARLLETVNYLKENCFLDGGFFHDIAHSGINPYLTLHVAQVFLRAGNPEYYPALQAIARLATSTGQWPEAIHPQTRGGCMGDGQHIWASAEWIMMMRNLFVREEAGRLILASGIPEEWLKEKNTLKWGPAATEFGKVGVEIQCGEKEISVRWEALWFAEEPAVEIRLPGRKTETVPRGQREFLFARR